MSSSFDLVAVKVPAGSDVDQHLAFLHASLAVMQAQLLALSSIVKSSHHLTDEQWRSLVEESGESLERAFEEEIARAEKSEAQHDD